MSSLPPPLPVPKQKLSGCAIAAIVVGVLIALVIIGLGISTYVFVKQAGGRGGIAKSAIGMANPDYEIIDLDDKEKSITVRHKKTGKTATFPLSHMKDGRVDPAELGLSREEAEGTGSAPSWVKYPGGRQVTAAQLMGITTLIYQSSDPVEKVMAYYKNIIGEQGLRVTHEQAGAIVLNDGKGSLQISAAASGTKGTVITVVYRAK